MNKKEFKLWLKLWAKHPYICAFTAILFFTGCGLVYSVSWKIFVGLILILWATNLDEYLKGLMHREREVSDE